MIIVLYGRTSLIRKKGKRHGSLAAHKKRSRDSGFFFFAVLSIHLCFKYEAFLWSDPFGLSNRYPLVLGTFSSIPSIGRYRRFPMLQPLAFWSSLEDACPQPSSWYPNCKSRKSVLFWPSVITSLHLSADGLHLFIPNAQIVPKTLVYFGK